MLSEFQPFAISFLIGFIIGLEREHSHPKGTQIIGVRTFSLIALLGTLASWIQSPYLSVSIALFTFCAILLTYIRSTQQHRKYMDIGITTEISACVVFCLGYIVIKSPTIAILLTTILLFILINRSTLHTFARHKLKTNEIRAFTLLALLSFVVLPFLPNQTIDPWGLLNPQRLGILIAILAGVQFIGYIGNRLFGKKIGMLLAGFLGGLASSTAVFAHIARAAKTEPTSHLSYYIATLSATLASLTALILIVFIASHTLLSHLIWPLAATMCVGLTACLIILAYEPPTREIKTLRNPLEWQGVFKLAAFIVVLLVLVTIAKNIFNIYGLGVVAFLSGLFELHSIILVTASLFAEGKLSLSDATLSIYLATLASFFSKFMIVWILSPNRFAVIISLLLIGMLTAGAITLVLFV